ncbi:hypothetical protein D3C81_2057260 [compost metagenome]
MVECQIARSLENERLEVVDRPFAQCPGDPQIRFLQQVFGGAWIVDHPLQGSEQADALGDEDVIEAGLAHSDT